MKKLTASNETESSKPKQGLEMRSIDVENANKKPGVGSRFTKIGGGGAAGAAGAAGGRFKKVGVAVSGKEGGYEDVSGKTGEDTKKVVDSVEVPAAAAAAAMPIVEADVKNEEDVVMANDEEGDEITWGEYDFTKPTGCDHASCPGCKTDGIWSGEWMAVDAV